MRSRSAVARALVLALVLAGCSKPKTRSQAAIDKIVEIKDRACACTDRDCVAFAKKELADWLLHNSDELGTLTFTPAQDAAGKKASEEMDACVTRMMQSPAPAP
jgi:hypothetical protein